jgi:hypothetical protein
LKRLLLFIILNIIVLNVVLAQMPDKVYQPYIATAQLYPQGDQTQLPIFILGGANTFILSFDDLEGGYKNYYYTYQLCDYNWKQVDFLQPLDYIKGFTQNRITTFRYASIAFTRYTHYEASLPDRNATPTKSGNYLVKVFLDADTSKLVFTKRLLVVDQKSKINATVNQLLSAQNFTTHQKVRFTATTGDINAFSAAQQVKVTVIQNNNWNTAQTDIKPTFVRDNVLDYSNENLAQFPAGKEWRWLDLRSLRVQSDRVDHATYGNTYTDIFLRTDVDRSADRYVYYPDFDGAYSIFTWENINPFWQSDYAMVHFSFAPPNGKAFYKKDIYIAGQFTNYDLSPTYKMTFNDSTGFYEGKVFMKQGYYSYTYTLVDENGADKMNSLEGNYWETENNYTILVYYKGFADRSDLLIGAAQVNSRRDRPGLSF